MINHSTALPRIVEHKALLMVHHFRWWESKIGEKKIRNTAFSYLDTYDGVPAELMATLHPEIQKRIDHDALVAKATSAGEPIPEIYLVFFIIK